MGRSDAVGPRLLARCLSLLRGPRRGQQQGLVSRLRLWCRIDIQLPPEDRDTGVVRAQPGGAVAQEHGQPHLRPVPILVEWIERDDPTGVVERGPVLAALLQVRDQPPERGAVHRAQSLTGRRDPIVVDGRGEVPPVQIDRADGSLDIPGGGGCCRGLEQLHVQTVATRRKPLDGATGDRQQPIHVRGQVTQRVQLAPKVGERLRVGRVGPQRVGELVTRHRLPTLEEQQRQQALSRLVGQRHAIARQPDPPQELDVEHALPGSARCDG